MADVVARLLIAIRPMLYVPSKGNHRTHSLNHTFIAYVTPFSKGNIPLNVLSSSVPRHSPFTF